MSLFLYGFCWQGLAQSFDFGTFMANEGRSHTFVIHNQTKNVLKLGKIRSSCGCSQTALSRKELQPDESAELTVELLPFALSGEFTKSFYLETNRPEERFMKFTLSGIATPLLTISPEPMLHIGSVEPGQVISQEFHMTPTQEGVELQLKAVDGIEAQEVSFTRKGDLWQLKIVRTPLIEEDLAIQVLVQIKEPTGWPDVEFLLQGQVRAAAKSTSASQNVEPEKNSGSSE